ncbi:putative S-layer protein [Xenococcus sp. PCC 7305]|uniref:iron uptake porin n=1 Tax=Xenococcus sp. PCC 7305 TaxID=102125 RepID=UPI0002ACD15D|nr:putative S-layer protein [Xenococcus sp. PCC 7305]
MSLDMFKQWNLALKNNLSLINNLILLLLPLTVFSTTVVKAFASEESNPISQSPNPLQELQDFGYIDSIVLDDLEAMPLDEANEISLEDSNGLSQVTNVNQLRDVDPTDWAYEALRSLVDRYGCIVGFPDQTYRGGKALSRYEFAAGLNSCLNQIERLIISSEAILKEDLETIQRLIEEFQAELATLDQRIDNLDDRVAFLEDHQFSTTTKFTGNIFFNFTGAAAGDDVLAETNNLNTPLTIRRAARGTDNEPIVSNITDNPQITFSYYSWLNFKTSFTGKDTLVTQLVAGNGNSPANTFISAGLYNTFGVPFTDQTGAPGASDVAVRELFYDFPVVDKLRFVVGPRINWYRYFDNNAYTFFLTGASSYNSSGGTLVNAIDRGSGAVAIYDINDLLTFKLGYLGENTEFLPSAFFNTSSDPDKGLFSATQTLTAEMDFAIANRANIRLIYTRSTLDNNQPILDADGNITGFGIGGATGEPVYGVADDGSGGTIGDAPADTFSLNFDWTVVDWLGLFGRYSYGSTNILPRNPDIKDGEVNAQSFQVGLAFPDLGKEGALGSFSFVIPFDVLDGEKFLASGGGDGGTQYEFEWTYFYPVNRNIAIVPAFYLVANPNNFEDNPNIYTGNLRLQLSF